MDKLTPLFEQIDALLREKQSVSVGIDGRCASGKTTLAKIIAQKYDCNVFRADDFFLRPEQRTPERYAQIGGNLDYERLYDEVLSKLGRGEAFSYRAFSCRQNALTQPRSVAPKPLNIVEGSYTLSPRNATCFDLSVLLTVSEQVQRERILERNPHNADDFFNKWIPLEERYFAWLKTKVVADFTFDNSDGFLLPDS